MDFCQIRLRLLNKNEYCDVLPSSVEAEANKNTLFLIIREMIV